MANPDFAEDELIQFFPVSFRAPDLSDIVTGDNGEGGLLSFIRQLLVDDNIQAENSVDGVVNALNDSIRSIDDAGLKQRVTDIIKVFSAGQKIEGATDEHTDPMEFGHNEDFEDANVNVSSILVNDQRGGPALRNAKRLQLFFNAIPTTEISRCVPYLEVRLQSLLPALDASGSPQHPSLIRFLQKGLTMGDGNSASSADSIMASAAARGGLAGLSDTGKIPPQTVLLPGSFATGMEIFTSPQSLINPDADVIDPYRPFMSITGFKADHYFTHGAVSNLAHMLAELELVLHDRSRLADVTEFVGGGNFSWARLLVIYGWRHPDGPEVGNPYADLINGMRVVRFCTPANVSYSFNGVGQVKITLKLVDSGGTELYTVRLSEGRFDAVPKFVDRVKFVIDQMERVAGTKHGAHKSKSTLVKQVISQLDQYGAKPDVVKELRPILRKYLQRDPKDTGDQDIASLMSSDDVVQFLDTLQQKFGTDGTDGEESDQPVPHLRSQIDQYIRRKLDSLLAGPDPFQPSLVDDEFQHPNIPLTVEETRDFVNGDGPVLVSVGKFLSSFIAPALLNGGDAIDELQFIYYPLNDDAGAASRASIASFMLEYDKLVETFQSMARAKGTVDLTLTDALDIIKQQLQDQSQLFYDVAYVEPSNKKDPRKPSKGKLAKEKTKGRSKLDTAIEEAVKRYGGRFTKPELMCEFETVPVLKKQPGSANVAAGRRVLMRVHIMDKSASPYKDATQMLNSSVQGELGIFSKGTPPEVLQKAIAKGFVRVDDDGTVRLSVKRDGVKDLVKSIMPSITFGANNSMVTSAELASQAKHELTTVQIQRAARGSSVTPPGASPPGLPLLLQPHQLNMTCIGCPLLRPAEQLFVDFGTGTDADNIYGIAKATHEMAPGKFTSQVSFVAPSGYPAYYNAVNAVQQAIASLKETSKQIGK